MLVRSALDWAPALACKLVLAGTPTQAFLSPVASLFYKKSFDTGVLRMVGFCMSLGSNKYLQDLYYFACGNIQLSKYTSLDLSNFCATLLR